MPNTNRGRLALKENVEYVLRDANGKVKKLFNPNRLGAAIFSTFGVMPKLPIFGSFRDSLTISNLVVNAGLAGMASRANGAGGEAAFTYIALGIGTTAAAAGDTTLESEITTAGGERASATASRVTTTVSNDTAQLLNTFNFTGSFSVTESGVLNAASGGTLLARQVFAAISVSSGDSLQITWKFDFS
jgi:hypothetical protein